MAGKPSSALSHQIISYPSIRNYKIAIAFAASQNLSKAKAVNKMIGYFIDENFNSSQQEKFIKLFEMMSKQEKKRTAKVNTDNKIIIGYFQKPTNKLKNSF